MPDQREDHAPTGSVSSPVFDDAFFTKPRAKPRNKTKRAATPVLSNKVSEKRVKDQVRRVLKSMNVWFCTPIGSGFGAIAHDFIVCVPVASATGEVRGQFVSIETKSSTGKLRPRQIEAAKAIQASSGVVLVVYPGDVDNMRAALEAIMRGELPKGA